MNGKKIVLDTNVVLYILADKKLREILSENYIYISFVTELELLSYPKISKEEKRIILSFLEKVKIIDIENDIKKHTIDLRKSYNLKLPDAIICATAKHYDFILITEDKKLLNIEKIKSESLYQK